MGGGKVKARSTRKTDSRSFRPSIFGFTAVVRSVISLRIIVLLLGLLACGLRGRLFLLVHNEFCPVLLRVPLETSEIGFAIELIVSLEFDVSKAFED